MKKFLSAFMALLLVFLLAGCRVAAAYPLLCPESEIQEAAIVQIRYDGELHEETVGTVDAAETLAAFRQVQVYHWYGEPLAPVYENTEAVLRLTYADGSVEWINWNGQAHSTPDRGFRFYAGYYVFDEQAFRDFLDVLDTSPA